MFVFNSKIPNFGQILILGSCRLVQRIGLNNNSYLYFMVESFGYSSPSEVTSAVVVILSAYNFFQSCSSVIWGRLADRYGRKPALLFGLVSLTVGNIVFGHSKNAYMAIITKALMGTLNGNLILYRTLSQELIKTNLQFQYTVNRNKYR